MSSAQINGGPILALFDKTWFRVLVSIVMLVALGFGFAASAEFMRNPDANRVALATVAIVVGVLGIWALYLTVDNLVSVLPIRIRDFLRPFVFILPALLILGVFIIYPTIRTTWVSFFSFRRGTGIEAGSFGLQNYAALFTDPATFRALINNALWLILVPSFSVSVGLLIAVLVDRIKWENFAKSLIFLPMAISFVGAGVIWRFIYFNAPFGAQIGLLNAIVEAFGGEPQGWLRLEPWNNLFLIVIMIWLQTGYAMVILSSAVKGVPGELLEAARIDGAGEVRVFFQVIIPYITGTIVTVTTTIVILVLKVFDIVFVMTSGNFNTNVIANVMYQQMFVQGNFGRGSAAAVVLFIAVIPVLVHNVRSLKDRSL